MYQNTFRYTVYQCTNDVCGMRRVVGQRRKGSEWWNEEVGKAVAEKRRAFKEWLPQKLRQIPGTESGCETGHSRCKKNGGAVMGRAIGE